MVREIVAFVEDRVEEMRASVPNAQPLQVALLAALNIAEQLYKERKQEREQFEKAVSRVRVILDSLA